MELSLRRDDDTPIYRQIIGQIRDQIVSGVLPPGTRLPPMRQVAAECGLTRLTVHSAYAELQAQGLLDSHVGRGTFVAEDIPGGMDRGVRSQSSNGWVSQGSLVDLMRVDSSANMLSFAQAFPAPETYPVGEMARALQRATEEPGTFGYGSIQGDPGLRDEIAALLRDRGVRVSPDRVLVTAGAQQGIDLAVRALTDRDDVLLVEEPIYPGILNAAAQRGQRVVGVPADGGGIRIDALRAACRAHRPRMLYLIPASSNPTGRSLAANRREAILRLARAHNMLILEDDTYGLLSFGERTIPPLLRDDADERVIYIMSFSKVLAPALRLGALVAPPSLLPALGGVKGSSDLVCSALLQRALSHYLSDGHLAVHLESVTALYRERRDAMMAALRRHLPSCSWSQPDGGLSLWVEMPREIVERDFVADAAREGVGIVPGSVFFPQPHPGAAMRLSFGAHSVERIEEGVAALGQVLDSHLRRRTHVLSMASRGAGPLV